MKLKIKSLGKIGNADITIDGITIIAGKNNTGKSTIGKVLFATFNSLYDIQERIQKKRANEIRMIANKLLRNVAEVMTSPSRKISRIVKDISDFIIDSLGNMIQKESLVELILDYLKNSNIKVKETPELKELIEDMIDKAIDYASLPDEKIATELINRYFDKVFKSQINCLKSDHERAEVEFMIKNKPLKIAFENNQCLNWSTPFNILHEAFYIDNPFIIDHVIRDNYYLLSDLTSEMQSHLVSKLTENNDDIMDGIFDAVVAKDKLEDIYKLLSDITSDGELIMQNGELSLISSEFSNPITLINLSAGLKSFMIIKLLLENGILKDRDILILDEPEIHLHPEWQLVYAEIIVLLQKAFHLNIVVTTHSPHFLESIQYFSEKHQISDKCNYYLSEIIEGLCSFQNVSDDITKIYRQLVTPSMLLDTLKHRLMDDDEE